MIHVRYMFDKRITLCYISDSMNFLEAAIRY